MSTTEGEAAATEGEGEAPAEQEETAATEGAEGTGEAPAEEAPPAEQTPEEKAAAEAKEAEIKVAAGKYAKELLSTANKTMAAARRAEQRAQKLTQEQEKTASDLRAHQAFVKDVRENPLAALSALGIGDGTAKGFLQWQIERGGGERAAPSTEDEIKALKAERQAEKEAAARAAQEREIAESRARIKDAISKDTTRYARAASRVGQDMLWEAIKGYHAEHGACPDAAVYALADGVERQLRADFGEPIPAPATGANSGTPPAAGAAPAGRNGGKTLTNKQTSGAPAATDLSLDPDERRRQVNEELRQQGLL